MELDPSNYFNQLNLGSLFVAHAEELVAAKQCADAASTYTSGINHLQLAFQIADAQPDKNTDQQKNQDYQAVQQKLQQAQDAQKKPCP